jgi:hypothetical protein
LEVVYIVQHTSILIYLGHYESSLSAFQRLSGKALYPRALLYST